MVELPEDMTEDDLHQWLSEGYCLYHGKAWAYWGDAETNDDGQVRRFGLVRDDGVTHVSLDEVQCFWPICGAINITKWGIGIGVYVERRQRRQWRRTFNANCVQVEVPNQWVVQQAFKSKRHPVHGVRQITLEMVDELFSPTYPSVREAVESIASGRAISVAVTPQVTLVGDGKGQHAVYYRTTLVGGWRNNVFTASVKGHMTDTTEMLLREGTR